MEPALPPRAASRSGRDTRRALLDAATRLFAQRGYDGTSVRDIAEAAGVNLAMVSYHFSGKEGLYAACIEPYGRSELDVARQLLTPENAQQGADRFRQTLLQFSVEQANLRIQQPDVSIIVSRECDGGIPIAERLFRDTFLQTVNLIRDFFESGRKSGIIQRHVDPLHAAGLLYGAISQVLRTSKLAAKFHKRNLADPKFREQVFTDWIDMIWFGIRSETRTPSQKNSSRRKRARK
jgi:AcrR family transcriptional regulator